MRVIKKSYRFKLIPTKEQEVLMEKHFGSVRFIYNHFLSERKNQYKSNKKSDNYYVQSKALTELKKKEENIWLKEINSQTLQFALKSLDTAYANFFKGSSQFPKFKSRKQRKSFTVPQHTNLVNSKVYVPKFREGIKCITHREVKGKIGSMTFSKTPTGKYFVSILTEEQYQPKKLTGAVVGIDLGLKYFAITSDKIKFKNNKYIKQHERVLAKAQKHLSRKKKGSNSFKRQKIKVAKIHEKTSNTRKDMLHKVSHQLISNYDLIALESLNVKGMMKNKNLSKHIADASWGMFVDFLEYKADWDNKKIVKINQWYPSSKICNVCGWVNKDMDLSVRKWTCKNGHHLDRDLNASLNILKEGLIITSSGAGDYTDGDPSKTLLSKQRSMNSETCSMNMVAHEDLLKIGGKKARKE